MGKLKISMRLFTLKELAVRGGEYEKQDIVFLWLIKKGILRGRRRDYFFREYEECSRMLFGLE